MTRTYEATVENGQIKLLETVRVPDHTKVFGVLPDVAQPRNSGVSGLRHRPLNVEMEN